MNTKRNICRNSIYCHHVGTVSIRICPIWTHVNALPCRIFSEHSIRASSFTLSFLHMRIHGGAHWNAVSSRIISISRWRGWAVPDARMTKVISVLSWGTIFATVSLSPFNDLKVSFWIVWAFLHTFKGCRVAVERSGAFIEAFIRIIKGVSRGAVSDTVTGYIISICYIQTLLDTKPGMVISEPVIWACQNTDPFRDIFEF